MNHTVDSQEVSEVVGTGVHTQPEPGDSDVDRCALTDEAASRKVGESR